MDEFSRQATDVFATALSVFAVVMVVVSIV